MRYWFLTLLSLFSIYHFAQEGAKKIKIKKEAADTINYIYINSFNQYFLKKVIQGKSNIRHNCNKDLWFLSPLDSVYCRHFNVQHYRNNIQPKDTISNINWYLINHLGCIKGLCSKEPNFAKLKINKVSNILILEKILCFSDTIPIKLMFRVIKFSSFEIILQDLKKLPSIRYYYFQKSYSKGYFH